MSSYSKDFRYIVLYRVCLDLIGPIKLQGKNRKHYFMILFDKYSYCLKVILLKLKNKVEENLKFLIEYIEVETGQHVKFLRLNGGGEYISEAVL